MNYDRKSRRFECAGLNLSRAVDDMPASKYPILRNVRVVQQGVIEAREGISRINSEPLDQLNVHSIRRLNDTTPSALWTRVVGGGSKIYTGQTEFTERDAGYSGNPLSLILFRPERSPQPWIYVADANKLRKIRWDGTNYAVGIAPPTAAPGAELAGVPLYNILSEFDAVGTWVNGGTAGAISAAARVNTTIARILYDSGITGWCLIQPTASDEGIQVGMRLIVNSGGGTAETVTVEEIHRPISNTSIVAISYDSGVTGLCTVQLATATKGLARNSLLLLDPGGAAQEAVRVLSVTEGPDGNYSLRCSTVNTQVAGAIVNGLAAFRCYCANNHAATETLTTNYLQTTVTTGAGHMTLAAVFDLSRIGTRPTQPDDRLHISISVDNPENVSEAKILLDCDNATNDFTQNFFFAALRAADLTPSVENILTVPTMRQRAIQRKLLDQYGTWKYREPDMLGLEQGEQEVPAEYWPVAEEAITGASQWTELFLKVSDLSRVGSDATRGLANVAAIRIYLSVTAATVLRVDAWWLGGSYGPMAAAGAPDVGLSAGALGTPYKYRYRYRSSSTGAKSLPGPETRYGLTPRRQRVTLTATVSADPQVDKIDFEQFGGSFNEWRYIGTTQNSGSPSFNHDLPDEEIENNPALETDAFQPFPIADLPKSGTCNVRGTRVIWVSGDNFNTSWARGTPIKINGVPYELYTQPASTTVLETRQNVGNLAGATWVIEEPILLGRPLPIMWGPLPDTNMMFACGDDRNPGTIYATKGNDPDSAPERYKLEVTPPGEPLMGGCIYDGKCYAASSERWFWIRVNSEGPNVLEAQDLPVGVGLFASWAISANSKVRFLGKDGIYETTGGPATSLTDTDLYALFPHEGVAGVAVNGFNPPDMTQPASLRLHEYDGLLYFDYVDTAGTRQTLIYDGELGGWFPDTYTPGQIFHYGEEGEGIHALLSGGPDGKVYRSGGYADGDSVIACQVRTESWNCGDVRAKKKWGDLVVDLDPAGATVTAQPGFNKYGTLTTAGSISSIGRSPVVVELSGQLAIDLALDLSWSSSTVRPKVYGWEPAVIPQPEDIYKRTTDWIDLGGSTFLQGIHLEADTGGTARTVQVQYDGGAVGDTITVNHDGQIENGYSFAVPFIAHKIRLSATDGGAWRFYGLKPVGEPVPDLATTWETQETTHDLPGYHHLGPYAYIAHASTAEITMRVTVGNTTYAYAIPSSGGSYEKARVLLEPMKGKARKYRFASAEGFRLFQRDSEVLVKSWGDPGPYKVVNPFGDLHRESGAKI